MNRIAGQPLFIFFTVLALVLFPFTGTVLAQDEMDEEVQTAGEMTFDLFILRPMGIFATLLGSAAFVVSFPFSAMGGNVDAAYEKMIETPADYTFSRPLGSF